MKIVQFHDSKNWRDRVIHVIKDPTDTVQVYGDHDQPRVRGVVNENAIGL
jgi:hypothetical protein